MRKGLFLSFIYFLFSWIEVYLLSSLLKSNAFIGARSAIFSVYPEYWVWAFEYVYEGSEFRERDESEDIKELDYVDNKNYWLEERKVCGFYSFIWI